MKIYQTITKLENLVLLSILKALILSNCLKCTVENGIDLRMWWRVYRKLVCSKLIRFNIKHFINYGKIVLSKENTKDLKD